MFIGYALLVLAAAYPAVILWCAWRIEQVRKAK
jgi:hypothetical protein